VRAFEGNGAPRIGARPLAQVVLAAAVAGLVLAFGCASAFAASPEAPELKVTYRWNKGATLKGVLNPHKRGEEGIYEFLYGEGAQCEGGHVIEGGISFGFPGEEVDQELAELEPGTEYTVCLLAHNLLGETSKSPPVSFRTTSPSELPEAPKAEPASGVSDSTATLEGVLNPQSAIPIRWFFRYAKGPSCSGSEADTTALVPPSEVSIANEEVTPVPRKEPVSASVSGLKRGMQYTYCLIAVNEEAEELSSAPVSFTTAAVGPAIGEESFSDVGSASAVLEAQVDPYGTATSYHFEYGTSASYGLSTPVESVGASAQEVGVKASVSQLKAGTTYHFRVVATNEIGETAYGTDATFSTFAPETPGLPDGRAYEVVSSLENGTSVFEPKEEGQNGNTGFGFRTQRPFRAAAGGDAFTYLGTAAPAGGNGASEEELGVQFLAHRGHSGWSAGVLQPNDFLSPQFQSFSSDLSVGILDSTEALTPGVPERYDVPYADSTSTGALSPLFTSTPPQRGSRAGEFWAYGVAEGEPGEYLAFAGASADFSHLLFEANDALTQLAERTLPSQEENDLYDSVSGRPYLVNVLPGGEPAPNATFGFSPPTVLYSREGLKVQPDFEHVISSDGSRIFWTDLSTGVLYVRENDTASEERCAIPQPAGAACTVQVSQGVFPGQYLSATLDGRYVVYSEGGDLYRFDVETGGRETLAGESYITTGTGELTVGAREVTSVTGSFTAGESVYGPGIPPDTYILEVNGSTLQLSEPAFSGGTHVALAAGGAEVHGLLGSSENGEYIYFAAGGALSTGASRRNCAERAEKECNVYALHVGENSPRFVAILSSLDGAGKGTTTSSGNPQRGDWQPDVGYRTAFVTPGGLHLVFQSTRNLTSFPSDGVREIYMYDFSAGELTCVSCNPRGTPESQEGAELPVSFSNTFQHRFVSSDGDRVFFNTAEALVPQDKNGKSDAYEWERDGTGSCSRAPGCVYLLSGGTSADNSYFLDASENGDDVFIDSRTDLVPQDKGEVFEVFDAHVCTSEAPCPQETTLACTGTGCQGTPSAPPTFATPPSATADGPENPAPTPAVIKQKPKTLKCKKGEVKKKVKKKEECVKKSKKRSKAKEYKRRETR
jgi:hypothetical protein